MPFLNLLKSRRFAPLFATAVLDAFNDNLFKTALLMLASYGLYRAEPARAELLAAIAGAVFVAPFFLFSALAGQVADAVDRARVVRWVKTAEVAIMALASGASPCSRSRSSWACCSWPASTRRSTRR